MLKNISTADLKEGIQIRLKTNPETVRRYAETMEENAGQFPFPPLDVYLIDGELHIADGHHRWQAALAAGLETVPCFVHEGTEADLLATAFNGNSRNALQMTDADLKHGREVAILKFPNKSDRELAAICKCSAMTINRTKREMEEKGLFARPETVTGKDGKEYKSGVSVLHLKKNTGFNSDEFRRRVDEIEASKLPESQRDSMIAAEMVYQLRSYSQEQSRKILNLIAEKTVGLKNFEKFCENSLKSR